jgi:membrane protease YdiL (CAAX protease family)
MTTPESSSEPDEPAVSSREEVGTAFVADAPRSIDPVVTSAPAEVRKVSGGRDALFRWAGIAVVIIVTGAGAHFAFDLDRAGASSFWCFAILPTVLVALFALARAARDGELWDLIRPAWGDASQGIFSAAVLFGAAFAFLHTVAPAGSPRESWTARLYLQLGDPGWLRAHTGMMAIVVLVAAAAEEIVWRGLVTRLIAEQVGSRTAWVWAAIPYALSLVPTAWALRDPVAGLNPLLIAGALGLGLVWGGMARWTGRLSPGILSHAVFDWCVIMVFRLWGSGI